MSLHQFTHFPFRVRRKPTRTHLVTDAPIVSGRLRRLRGAPLCGHKMSGLLERAVEQLPVGQLCSRCVQVAERLGHNLHPVEITGTMMLAAYRAVDKVNDRQWSFVFEEADKNSPIGLFETGEDGVILPSTRMIYNGPARALVLVLDEELDGLDEAERTFFTSVEQHGCGPSGDAEVRACTSLIRKGLVEDAPEGAEDAMRLRPLGRALLQWWRCPCWVCEGTGVIPGPASSSVRCEACGGLGQTERDRRAAFSPLVPS